MAWHQRELLKCWSKPLKGMGKRFIPDAWSEDGDESQRRRFLYEQTQNNHCVARIQRGT
jgi:hypothetical protein